MPADDTCRIDRWLWAVRIFKTRSLAASACRGGHVRLGDTVVKPARDVRIGEVVTVRDGLLERRFVVKGLPASRVGAKLVPDFCEDRTPPEAIEQVKAARVQQVLARDRGAGRPTKRDRRQLDQLLGGG
ncbi:RNA-binding S4 domain-containing protein [Actomonas aquatica]|uniref:RNA-binding S4 domain-containing protein n=1 Tax=Actomonas aquatica TaxID=2866162 RepID=A0ABZ1C267_9BACT|nr:RNA-binding S4 domain-containing protein [Opitutus sp. WL0086]WRQ85579.1 RNA-binding S4 domain-containing protein [Opitutus sp. WL0086]